MTETVDAEMVPEDAREASASIGTDTIPGYLALVDEDTKAEARRAYVMSLVTDDNSVLLANWEKDALKIESYLKTGSMEPEAKQRGPMKVVK